MPKKSLKINQFHGGLNNFRDKRDTPDNALVNASNIMVDIPGKIRMMGRDMPFEELANTINIAGGVTPGYGLFAFKADHDLSGAATNDGNVFVVYQNGNKFNVAQNGIIYDPDTAIDGITAGFNPSWSGAFFTVFHYTNERLFISDGNFDNITNMPYVYEFLGHTRFPSNASHKLPVAAGWYGNSATYPAPAGTIAVTANLAAGTVSNADEAMMISAMNTNDVATTGGQWENQYIWIGVSYLYGEEESKIYKHDANTEIQLNGGAGELKLSLDYAVTDNGASGLDKRITGINIYLMGTSDDSNPVFKDDPELLAKADMINETLTSHEGITVDWKHTSVGGGTHSIIDNATPLLIKTLPTTTFEMENLYPHDVPTIRAKWKTSAVMGNQIFLGNVRTYKDDSISTANEIVEPDRILRVMPPPLSKRAGIFPSSDFLEVASGDGDEIIKLETFADRLIVLKRNTTYVINISGDIEFIEQEYKFSGIAAPYNAISTEFGIVWVNPKGAYLYDGEKLTNLIEGKIDPYIESSLSSSITVDEEGVSHSDTMPGWANFIGNSGGQIGYLPEEKHLIIFDTPYGNYENQDQINIQGNMMILDFKSGSWTYATDRISPFSRSNIISGVNKSCLFLGNVSTGVNTITTTILKPGKPYVNFYQEIVGITNDQVSPAGTAYRLVLFDGGEDYIDLTEDFTWTPEEQNSVATTSSYSFAHKIVDEIINGYNDENSSSNILAEAVTEDEAGTSYKVKVIFAAPDINASNQPPNIFNKEIQWKTDGIYTIPSASAANLHFFNSGLGCGIAPIRSWYQKEAMTNHSNYTGNAHVGVSGAPMENLINTWGGLEKYPHIEVDRVIDEQSGYYFSLPHFAPKNYIYKWIVNKAALYVGQEQQPFYDNTSYTFDVTYDAGGNMVPDDPESLLAGLPWDTNLKFGYNSQNDGGGSDEAGNWFFANSELFKRNEGVSPLFAYTGFVFNPLSGQNMLRWNGMIDDNIYAEDQSFTNSSTYAEARMSHTASASRTNPRLVRYMCQFNHNPSLLEYSTPSPNITNGPGYILPNEINNGAYISPGLIFTQSWSTDSEDLHDRFEDLGGNNSGADQRNGNGFYTNNAGTQSGTQWPNGYFYFGFGVNQPNCKIVEGVGVTSTSMDAGAGLGNTEMNFMNTDPYRASNEAYSYVNHDNSFIRDLGSYSNADIYANHYFIGWQTEFFDHSNTIEDVTNKPEYFISKDLLDPGTNFLFNNFGDLMYTHGMKWPVPHTTFNGPFQDSNIQNEKVSKNLYGFSNSFPKTQYWYDNRPLADNENAYLRFYDEYKETKVYGNGIPFNQQSPTDALTCEGRDNMLTRDFALFEEPEGDITHNGIPLITALNGFSGSSHVTTATRSKANSIWSTQGLQSLVIMPPDENNKTWEDSTIFAPIEYSQQSLGFAYEGFTTGDVIPPDGNLPSAVSYSSIPYLVIESTPNALILHFTCDYDGNKLAHVLNNKYEWLLPDNDQLNYEMQDMVLTGGKIINIFTNKFKLIENLSLDHTLDDTDYEGQTYDPIHNMTWGINGYCQLIFNKNSQNNTNKNRIEYLYATSGTVAFWSNPLKNEDQEMPINHIQYGYTEPVDFYPPHVKDTYDLDYDERILTDITDETNADLTLSDGGAGVGFTLFSRGDNGEKREIILHNSRDMDGNQTDTLQANILITKTGNANTPKMESASNILWTEDNYDDSLDVNQLFKSQIGGTAGIFGEVPDFVNIKAGGSTDYPQITATGNASVEGTNIFSLQAVDKDFTLDEEFPISLEKYVAVGDMIYLSSSSIKYRVSGISYNSFISTTFIIIDQTVYTDDPDDISGSTQVYNSVHANDTAQGLSLTCGALHFKDSGPSTIKSDLFISGGYSGELKVLQFDNSSTFADKVSGTGDYTTGGSIFIETKDYNFDNPSSLKNINFIDISMKGTGTKPNIKYALDNSGNFNNTIQLETSEAFNDLFNFKTFRYKLTNGHSIKNCKSIALRIESLATEGFELNDITIVYREKTL